MEDTDLISACAAFTGPQEGDIAWPYRDTTGNVTAGRGHLIASAAILAQVFGVDPEKAQEAWNDLMACEPGYPAAFYETITDLRLTPERSDEMFRGDLAAHIANCGRLISGFSMVESLNPYPLPVRVAAVDLDLNVRGGIKTFPHFIACVEAGDWVGAAEQSDRPQLPARSAATKKLILSAVQLVT